ncbi:hypothetical protein J3F83DRAFT_720496 [Trichoderma novae-zelandiae]
MFALIIMMIARVCSRYGAGIPDKDCCQSRLQTNQPFIHHSSTYTHLRPLNYHVLSMLVPRQAAGLAESPWPKLNVGRLLAYLERQRPTLASTKVRSFWAMGFQLPPGVSSWQRFSIGPCLVSYPSDDG